MGDARMTIEVVGGHGCDRNAKKGDEVIGCGRETCPDCMFARFVSDLQRAGMRPTKATFHHWPADMQEHDFPRRDPGTPPPSPDERCARCNTSRAEATATHRCRECNSLWVLHAETPAPASRCGWSFITSGGPRGSGSCCDSIEAKEKNLVTLSPEKDWPIRCRLYFPDREVIDDYTERDVRYPTGAFHRATGKRIKGSF